MFRAGQGGVFTLLIVMALTASSASGTGAHGKASSATENRLKGVPPSSPRQEQSARGRVEVTYLDGQLTITGRNSSLAEILSAVCAQTGVAVELPPGADSDRVASRMGPGPVREVLAALLNGSSFDYIMTGPTSDPASVDHIILIPRPDQSDVVNSKQNGLGSASPQLQSSHQYANTGNAISGDAAEAGGDSEEPTRVVISEAEDPPERDNEEQPPPDEQQRSRGQMQQLLGTSPQQPASSPGGTPGVPNLSPHN